MGSTQAYFSELHRLIVQAQVHDRSGAALDVQTGTDRMIAMARAAHAAGNKMMIIGNGGSAGIASHMATDFSKNGNIRTQAFNDGSMLTCLGNDLGYENVFAKQMELFARSGDLLVAISSSGASPNILKAVDAARTAGCDVVTFSGFSAQNPLRKLGDINFYVESHEYGFVEVGHQALLHAVLDLAMGW